MRYKLIPTLLFAIGVLNLFAYTTNGPDALWYEWYDNIIYLVAAFMPIVTGLMLLKTSGYKGKINKIFLLIIAALFLWFLGEVLWTIYIMVWDLDPFPSFIDIVYMSAYPLFFVAFWKQYRSNKIIWDNKKIITYLSLAILLLAVTIYYGMYKAYDIESSFWENTFSIGYGLADAVLIIMLLWILMIIHSYQKAKFAMPWNYMLLGMVFTIMADILYALYYEPYEDGIRIYQFMDMLWIIGFLFFAQSFFKFRETIVEAQNRLK